MRRIFWILITPVTITLLWFFSWTYWIKPKIELYALDKIQSIAKSNGPLQVNAEAFHFDIFPIQAELKHIELHPKSDLKQIMNPIKIENIVLTSDPIHLLLGQFSFFRFSIQSPVIEINIDPLIKEDSPPTELPIKTILSALDQIPIDKLTIDKLNLILNSNKFKTVISFENSSGQFQFRNQSLISKLDLQKIKLKNDTIGEIEGNLSSHLLLTENFLKILQLSFKIDEAEVQGHGIVPQIAKISLDPQFQLSLSTKLNLSEIHKQLSSVLKKEEIPDLSGNLNAEAELKYEHKKIEGQVKVQTQQLKVDQFEIGNAQLQGLFKDRSVSLNELNMNHPSGNIQLKNTHINFNDNFNFNTNLYSSSIDMQKLFVSLGLTQIPVGVKLQAHLPCEGQIKNFQLKCTGELIGQELWIHSGMDKNASDILDIKNLSTQGEVEINSRQVNFKTQLKVGDSLGDVWGIVDLQNGFDIKYKTKSFDFKNISNLSHLNLKGITSLEGSTQGNSDNAIFDIKIDGKDFHIDRFYLGQLSTYMTFKKGIMNFSNLKGALPYSLFSGDIQIDLNKSNVEGQLKFAQTDLSDISLILKDFYKLPVDISGIGAAKISFNGPLDFWKLNYNLESQFNKGIIGTDSFDTLTANVEGHQGNMQFKQVMLKKNKSTVFVKGQISNEQKFDMVVDGHQFRIEESELISKHTSTLLGLLNWKTDIEGSIEDPKVNFNAKVTETILDDQEAEDSELKMSLSHKKIELLTNLFGQKISSSLIYDFGKNENLNLNVKTYKWDFTSLLGLIGAAGLQSEYNSSLTSELILNFNPSEVNSMNGNFKIQDFILQRGSHVLKNSSPIDVTSRNGVFSIQNFYLTGDKNYLKIQGENFTTQNVSLKISSSLELRLLHMFLPFLEDFSGSVDIEAQSRGPYTKPEIFGEAKLSDGFVKIHGFPHPFEKINADINFSQSKVLIPQLSSTFANGNLTGDGEIQIAGVRNLPLKINVRGEGLNLNFPEKIKSNGFADLTLSGNWFPFLLAGQYTIQSASFEKDFGDDEKNVSVQKQSAYLPTTAKESNFDPMKFDINLNITKNVILKNSLTQGSVTGGIQVKGTVSNPLLGGKINIDKGTKLLVKDKMFDVQVGSVQFSSENEINPEVYITAQSRVSDYDVNLLVQGPAKNLNFKFNSLPPLPENDIISLLALGVTSSKLDQAKSGAQQEQTGYEIGNAILSQSSLVKKLKSELDVDVKITPVYDITGNITNRKVTFSRQLNRKVKGSISQTMGEQQSEFKLEYDFDPHFSAIGSWENKENTTKGVNESSSQNENKSILGIDFEYRKEFR